MYSRIANPFRSVLLGITLLFASMAPVRAVDADSAVMLVATPALSDPIYKATVLIAHPMSDGRIVGFIVNKPTKMTLAQAFPEHGPSKKVADPIYLGGPERLNTLFALVQTAQSPGKGSMQLTPDLFLVLAGETVDQVIEHDPDHARFLFGVVIWQPGELDSEIKRGAWYVERPETDLIMGKEPGKLWERLLQRLNSRRGAV